MTIDSNLGVGPYVIPATELSWSFSPSGGPGGQHANRSSTRAELRFDLASSEVFETELKQRMIERLGSRVTGEGIVAVSVDESRSQWRNRSIARRRMADLLSEAMRPPTIRRPTKPTSASRRRRIESKRRRSEIKKLRQPPESG